MHGMSISDKMNVTDGSNSFYRQNKKWRKDRYCCKSSIPRRHAVTVFKHREDNDASDF